MKKSILRLRVNGQPREDAVADNMLLIDYLREVVKLTGTKMGCDGGECGACTVLVDDRPRLSCISLAGVLRGAGASIPSRAARPGTAGCRSLQKGLSRKARLRSAATAHPA